MQKLLSILKTIPEYQLLLQAVENHKTSAVTGIGQINRSHLMAGLYADCRRPMVVICQDDMAAKRLMEELKAFLGLSFPVLPSRELTMYDTAVVSRGWEQKRLRQLFDLATGKTSLQIMSWEAMSQRTIPKNTLLGAAFSLKLGDEWNMES
jgi:transcription-repair coupling factor (superfamily II helicase)